MDNILNVPKRYIPAVLSLNDTKKQRAYLTKSRRLYKRGKFFARPKLGSFKSKPSGHVATAKKRFGVDTIGATAELARKSGCTRKALAKILNKGRGAYYSSGSRPNQTAESWAKARLASALTGGPAAKVDHTILEEGCKKGGSSSKSVKTKTHKWSTKYKKSIDCKNPHGFSQKQYCNYGRTRQNNIFENKI